MRYFFLIIVLFVTSWANANEEQSTSKSVVVVTITDHDGAAGDVFTSFSHFTGETIQKEGVYLHESLHYIDEEYEGDLMIQLYESIYPNGLFITSFSFGKNDIFEGKTETRANFSVEVKYISKAEMASSPDIYCAAATHTIPLSITQSQSGNIQGEISVSDRNPSTANYTFPVTSEAVSLSVYAIENYYPHLLGEELFVTFTQTYFPEYGTDSFQGLFILEPPPPLTVILPDILCSGGSVESITINGFPDNETDASLRIDMIKLVSSPSYSGAPSDTTVNGVDYYWIDQETMILTNEEVNPVNNSITLNPESVTSDNFEFDEGVYGIKVFYYDGGSSLCPSTTFFVVDDPDPLELSLTHDTITSSGGQEYHIPVNGETVTIGGSVSGNQGGYSINYEDENGNSEAFTIDNTQLGQGEYTFLAVDDAGCESNLVSLDLDEPNPISLTGDRAYDPKCNENNTTDTEKKTGSIYFKVLGGIPNFYAECINDATDETLVIEEFGRSVDKEFTELDPGTYTLKIWDNGDPQREDGGAVFSKNYTISAPDEMTMTASPKDVNCFGGKDGTIELEVTNGTESFSYNAGGGKTISFSDTPHTIRGLDSGDYTITVTDANECEVTSGSKSISKPTSALSITKDGTSSPETCKLENGSLILNVSGGWASERYIINLDSDNISFSSRSDTISSAGQVPFDGLPAGDYTVEVTNGSCPTPLVKTFTVDNYNPLAALKIDQTREASCDEVPDAVLEIENPDIIQGNYSWKINGNTYPHDNGIVSNVPAGSNASIYIAEESDRGCVFYNPDLNVTKITPVSIDTQSSVIDSVSCSDAYDGSINVRGKNGRGSYTYKLEGGEEYKNDSVFGDRSFGNYNILIKDSVGCENSHSFTVPVKENPISVGEIINNRASCWTSKDGSITLENIEHNLEQDLLVEYGDTLITISSGESVTYPNIGPGSYDFIISYTDECSYTETVELGHNSYQPDFDSPEILEEVACRGKNNGRIRLKEKSGINDNYSYHIFENPDFTGDTIAVGNVEEQNIFDVEGLPESAEAGFSIYILDEKGCGDSLVFEMPITNNSLEISLTPSPASCVEVANGELYISATGGFPFGDGEYQFSYEKNGNVVSRQADNWTVPNLAVGDYLNVSVEDKYGCSVSDARTIEIKDDHTQILGFETTNPACNGTATGSSMPLMIWTPEDIDFNYSLFSVDEETDENSEIDSGVVDEDNFVFSGMTSGLYDLNVVDSDGCQSAMRFRLNDPEPVSVNVNHNYIRAKGDSTGTFNIDLAGGNEKYEIAWSKLPEEELYANPDTVTEFSYSVASLSAGDYFIAVRDTANCAYFDGESWFTQEITIAEPELALGIDSDTVFHVSCNKFSDGRIEVGGSGGWGPYLYSINGGENQNSGFFDGLTAGDYQIELTDTAGVSFSRSYTLTEPDTLNIFLDDFRDATCPLYANGYVEATVINGIDGSLGLQYSIEDISDGEVIEESFDDRSYGFFNLPKGNYELYVTDDHNCRASKQFAIDEPDTAAINITYNYIKKKGESTGEILSLVDGGNGIFDYQWYLDDGTEPIESGTTLGEIALESLSAGVYTLMVRDTAGCVYENNEWMEREITLEEPDTALNFTITENRAVSCYGLEDGFLKIKPTGGWGDYLVKIDEEPFSKKSDFEDLDALIYNITVRDSAGIEHSGFVEVAEPDTLRATLSDKNDISCFGGNNGNFSLDISGGNLAYFVSVDGENWIEGNQIDSLSKGQYTPQIKDTLGCSITINPVVLNQPPEITLRNDYIRKSRCANNEGSIISSFQGGVGEFQYAWSKDTIINFEENIVENIPLEGETDASVFNLYSGIYQVIVTDEHNCDVPFEFFVGDVTDLAIDTINTRDVWCWGYEDGEATASVIKGNPPYYYSWSGDVGSPSGTSASQIPAGEHQLLVTDSKGCAAIKKFEVGTPDSLYYNITTFEHPLCLGGEKGTIEVEGTGGIPGYSYQWSDGTSASFVNDLTPGVVELTLTDSHDCQSEFTFEMDYQRILLPDVGPDTTICHYDDLTLDGGDYNRFKWDNETGIFASTRTVTIETPGTYYLEVEDIDNCLGFDTLALKQSILEIESLTYSDVTCYNAKDGEAEIAVNSNKNDYSIVWPDGSGNFQWTGLSGGEYSVEVENPLGCFDQQSFTVAEPEPLSLTSSFINPLCYGVFNGEVIVSPSGGNGAYQYEWDHGAASGSLNSLDQGTYSVLVRDSKNCTISDIFNLSYTRSLMPDLGSDLVLCSNSVGYLSPGSFYGYRWFFNDEQIDTDSTLLVSEPGNYQVEVSDEDNCLAFDTIQVDQIMSDLSPEFLMVTSVPKGDTLMLVDVTNPKPTGLEWHISGNFEIVDEGDYFCEVVFDKEGIQFVTLSALMGDCMGQVQKQILVTPAVESSDLNQSSETNSSVFSSLTIYPNPTDGAFSVGVELKEEAPLNLYLVRLETGQIFEQSKMTGLKSYSKSYNISGTGQYVIFAECRGERLMGKVIVQ